jgi:uncharacterized protein (DUF849 family)
MAGEPCVIEVAVNGMTPREINPAVPRTPAEITADALRCIDAGAAIVHNHNDESLWEPSGRHAAEPYVDAWTPVLAAHPDVLVYPTMASGGPGIAVKDRWGHHHQLAEAGLLRMGLLDPGSLSLGGDRLYINTHDDARYMAGECARLGLAASVSIFDPSFLRVALALHREGALPHGALIKLYFGGDALPFGLPPTRPSLDAYLAMLDGTGLAWSVAVLGGDVIGCGLAADALGRGGHVRVGLEDYAGDRHPTNAELVAELRDLIVTSGSRVATPRETLGLLA